jgi:predicted N-acetyltransferase YhbS
VTASSWTIRVATPGDRIAIREINRQAFRSPQPGTFENLLELGDTLALVAELPDGTIAGHVIFTPAVIDAIPEPTAGMALGELAVLPAEQRRGIGNALGRAGLQILRDDGCPFCIVVGHAGYYPRFGFVKGSSLGLSCQWPKIPDDAFMVLVLDEGRMAHARGIARFRDVD